MKAMLAACLATLLSMAVQAEPLFQTERSYVWREGDPIVLLSDERGETLIHIREKAGDIAHPERYTHIVRESELLPVQYANFQNSKDPDQAGNVAGAVEDWSGYRFQPADKPLADKDNVRQTLMAFTPEWLEGRTPLPFTRTEDPRGENAQAMEKALLDKVLARYAGYEVARSAHLATINEGQYSLDVVQFAPRDNIAIAALVLAEGEQIYIREQRAEVMDGEYSWNVDDEGVYIPPQVIAALQSPRGVELYFADYTPESIGGGVLYVENAELVYLLLANWYLML